MAGVKLKPPVRGIIHQPADDFLGTVYASPHPRYGLLAFRIILRKTPRQQLQTHAYHGKRVLHFMRHTRRKPSHRFHLLRLDELLVRAGLFRVSPWHSSGPGDLGEVFGDAVNGITGKDAAREHAHDLRGEPVVPLEWGRP